MVQLRELDVRNILRDGGMPFQLIMDTFASLDPDEGVRLHAIFEPVPLIRQLEQRGYSHLSKRLADDDWEIDFVPREKPGSEPVTATAAAEAIWPEPSWNLDLTDLAPPEPMERILSRLESMKSGEVLFALLNREPLFLFNELKVRGHEWIGDFDASGKIYRIMIRATPANGSDART
ncbi:hypothetical conserved protein (plasmid) [Rhizobium etli CFN 42]|uniref:Hypothetical conserved protein n=1 Tax=Rhizobium etli (strain ATCC 51251 / DSM 11541 / JCM 21823 / NBRC 15573 / CFN 42) TaxID=347834 RepID=Q2JYC5_RHIEC|nr:DUF2249 domain-containing protein [Rhizobium etli]ABC94411.1 hypothetical conserved protein [Rhizobium etli CFN 42]